MALISNGGVCTRQRNKIEASAGGNVRTSTGIRCN